MRDVGSKDNKMMQAPAVINAQIINRENGMCFLSYFEICPIDFGDVQKTKRKGGNITA